MPELPQLEGRGILGILLQNQPVQAFSVYIDPNIYELKIFYNKGVSS